MEERDKRIAKNETVFRAANREIEHAEQEEGGGTHRPIEVLCECGRPGCSGLISLTIAQYKDVHSQDDRFVVVRGHENAGIEIGHLDLPAPASVLVQTTIINCDLGALKFTKDGGVGRYQVSVYQPTGRAVVVPPGSQMRQSNRLDILLSGGAEYGDLGALEPVTFQEDVLMRGDVRAGGRASKLGFFGAPAQPRSAPWSVAYLPDSRRLDATSDLAQTRAVLATLLRDLQRYGLLGGSPSG